MEIEKPNQTSILNIENASIFSLTSNDEEMILLFESVGKRVLTLASNFPYELWCDGQFVGIGGHRCTKDEFYADVWTACLRCERISVRVHWLHVKLSSVWYRQLFREFFFVDYQTDVEWIVTRDASIQFGAKASSQLPRQNKLLSNGERSQVNLFYPNSVKPTIKHLPVQRLAFVDVKPKKIAQATLGAQNRKEKQANFDNNLNAQPAAKFDPLSATDVVSYILNERSVALQCDTYDLESIALHRFEITAGTSPVVLCYSEVSEFKRTWATGNRKKVHLADAIGKHAERGSPFGTRGCRYLHLIYESTKNVMVAPTIHNIQRAEYPFDWIAKLPDASGCDAIIAACKANLVACVDGGVVDTCWRERAQWTGDARMSGMALRRLTRNPEIAQSYDPSTGQVQGAWPVKTPEHKSTAMPPYHLAFCLAVLEHYGSLSANAKEASNASTNTNAKFSSTANASLSAVDQSDCLSMRVVKESMKIWKSKYVKDGLLADLGMPGWYFTDWDQSNQETIARNDGERKGQPPESHSICNAYYDEVCLLLGWPSGLDASAFNKAFWKGQGYGLTPSGKANVHATAGILCCQESALMREKAGAGLKFLTSKIAGDFSELRKTVTAYYAYFVAKALHVRSTKKDAISFIKKYYGPIAEEFGTIYEKTNDDASMAHGWSVGVIDIILG